MTRAPGVVWRLLGAPGAQAGTIVLVAILTLAALAPDIATWADRYDPPAGEEHALGFDAG